ncbi:MAG: hypothetical protein RBR01_06865 [Desulfobacterales bacterium]|jgi:hypothetical protein|nr:hypothetical protein [Desulfobacterales bacterium]
MKKPPNWILYDLCDKDGNVKSSIFALHGIPAFETGFAKRPRRRDMRGTPFCRYRKNEFQEEFPDGSPDRMCALQKKVSNCWGASSALNKRTSFK